MHTQAMFGGLGKLFTGAYMPVISAALEYWPDLNFVSILDDWQAASVNVDNALAPHLH